MPAPAKLPTSDVLRQHRAKGMTYDEIAELYGVTKGAVYLRLRDSGQTSTRPDHSKYIPWTVRTEHAQARPNGMLRLYSRREQGETLPAVKERMLDKWLSELKEADVVVCYHREMAPNPASTTGGWYYSKRRPEDGKSLIRHTEDEPSEGAKSTKNVDPSETEHA
jgi:transcriptional regulator with XRE-family HTH domain